MTNNNVEKIFEVIKYPYKSQPSYGVEKYGYCESTKIDGKNGYIFTSDLIEFEYIMIKKGEIVAAIDKRCMNEFQFCLDNQYLATLSKIIYDFYCESPKTFMLLLDKLKFGTLGYLYTLCYVQKIKKEKLEKKYSNKMTAMDYYYKAVEEYKIDFEMKKNFLKALKVFCKKHKDNKNYENTIEYLNYNIESYEKTLTKSKFNIEIAISSVWLEIQKETRLSVDWEQIEDILNDNSQLTIESLIDEIKQLQKTNQLKLKSYYL